MILALFCGGISVLFILTPRLPQTFLTGQLPQTIRKDVPKNTIYEPEWKAENYFNDSQTLELCRAIEKQDVEEMRRLIDSGANVNAKGKENMPLLLWAYPAGEKGGECLLENGADPNVVLESSYMAPPDMASPGSTILYTAVMSSLGGEPKFATRSISY